MPGGDRDLILGGGSVLGLAWLTGAIHGLEAAGVELRAADKVIGTSAGAFAGVALFDERATQWSYQRQLADAVDEISAQVDPQRSQSPAASCR